MSFLWNKQKREQLPTSGRDDKDIVYAGIRYNVTFLGSILVPTPTGHGSSRAATAVDKVYLEKYKAFGYGSRKVRLDFSVDEVRIIGKDGGSEPLATFQMSAITYFNLDLKHDKAFVFIVGDENSKSYRAYVFHCENCTRARELSNKFKEAFKLKEIKSEEMRLRSLSLPSRTPEKITPNQTDENGADDLGCFQREEVSACRPRSKTDNIHSNQFKRLETRAVEEKNINSVTSGTPEGLTQAGILEDAEDEFTMLAEKRLRSFDDKALPGTFESKLLLDEDAIQPRKDTQLQFGASNNGEKSSENKNLLEL